MALVKTKKTLLFLLFPVSIVSLGAQDYTEKGLRHRSGVNHATRDSQ